MKWFKKRLLGSLTSIALLMLSPSVFAADLNDQVALEQFVDGVVQPLMKNHNSPSGTVAIIKGGQLIFAKGYGFQNVETQTPVDPFTTLFRPGSVSKLFAWVAVMQMVEQGKLDLDTDVNTYLNRFKIKETFDEPVTLRHILTHTAGFEDGGAGYLMVESADDIMPLAESLERYQPLRVNPPGAQTAYSNYATALAGLIVANVSGLGFNEYIQKHIFDVLGMDRSTFEEPLPSHLAQDMAASYTVENGRYVEKPFEIVAKFGPAGALSATSTDMMKFAQAVLNGGELNGKRILKPETMQQQLTRTFTHHEGMMGMALGFYEWEEGGVRLLGHGGDTQYFHSDMGIDLEHNVAFFVSFSSGGGGVVRSSFPAAFFQEYFAEAEAPPVPPADFGQRAANYAGTYLFWRGSFSKFEKAMGLAGGGINIVPTENNTLTVVGFGGSKEYAEVGKNLFRELDSGISLSPGLAPRLIGFQENSQGEITGFVVDGMPFMSSYKAAFYQTPSFSQTWLAVSLLLFVGVLLRRFYQRAAIKALPKAERKAHGVALNLALVNLAVFILGAVALLSVMTSMFSPIPPLFKLFVWTPFLVVIAEILMLVRTAQVWKNGLLAGTFARVRYSIVALVGLFMCWFYYYWNLIGPQYLT